MHMCTHRMQEIYTYISIWNYLMMKIIWIWEVKVLAASESNI